MDLLKINLVSKGLRLRAIKLSDKEDIFCEFTKEITKYMFPMPSESIDGVVSFIKGSLKRMSEGSNIQLVLEDSTSHEFYGCVGLHNMDNKTPEFGIWLKKGIHGHGYGKESIHMLYEFVLKNFNFDYILYPVDRDNIASRKIPESLGGVLKKEYNEETQSGSILNIVEYHVPCNNDLV